MQGADGSATITTEGAHPQQKLELRGSALKVLVNELIGASHFTAAANVVTATAQRVAMSRARGRMSSSNDQSRDQDMRQACAAEVHAPAGTTTMRMQVQPPPASSLESGLRRSKRSRTALIPMCH